MARYKPQTLDSFRTMEDQIHLLVIDAKRAYDIWTADEVLLHYPRLREAMQTLGRQISETDVFMSGVEAGRSEK